LFQKTYHPWEKFFLGEVGKWGSGEVGGWGGGEVGNFPEFRFDKRYV